MLQQIVFLAADQLRMKWRRSEETVQQRSAQFRLSRLSYATRNNAWQLKAGAPQRARSFLLYCTVLYCTYFSQVSSLLTFLPYSWYTLLYGRGARHVFAHCICLVAIHHVEGSAMAALWLKGHFDTLGMEHVGVPWVWHVFSTWPAIVHSHTTACIMYMSPDIYMGSGDISADNKAARVLEFMSWPGKIFIAIHHVVPWMNFEYMVI